MHTCQILLWPDCLNHLATTELYELQSLPDTVRAATHHRVQRRSVSMESYTFQPSLSHTSGPLASDPLAAVVARYDAVAGAPAKAARGTGVATEHAADAPSTQLDLHHPPETLIEARANSVAKPAAGALRLSEHARRCLALYQDDTATGSRSWQASPSTRSPSPVAQYRRSGKPPRPTTCQAAHPNTWSTPGSRTKQRAASASPQLDVHSRTGVQSAAARSRDWRALSAAALPAAVLPESRKAALHERLHSSQLVGAMRAAEHGPRVRPSTAPVRVAHTEQVCACQF